MKTLINKIAKKAIETNSDWNRKFYTSNDMITVVYVNNEKIDVTTEVNSLRDEKDIFHSDPVRDAYSELIGELEDLKFDLEDEGKSNEEIKKACFNKIS